MTDLPRLSLVDHDDPILSRPTLPVDPEAAPALRPLAVAMWRMMRDNRAENYSARAQVALASKPHAVERGCGLAANQVGRMERMFVLDFRVIGSGGFDGAYVCINPEIVQVLSVPVARPEGCLSFPGRRVSVARSEQVKVAYTDLKRKRRTTVFLARAARAFQHELDHLDGVTMIARSREQIA